MNFINSRVIVTAAGAGIGKRIAERFFESGATVFASDIDAQALSNLPEQIQHQNCDVSKLDEVEILFTTALASLGGLDILVNCAGTAGPTSTIEQSDPIAWQQCITVNLMGTYYCMRKALPILKSQQKGCIINLSSTAGILGYPLRSPYCAAKWGVIGLTKSAAMEAGPSGVRINAICPGSVEGERMDRVITAEAKQKNLSEQEIRNTYTKSNSLKTWINADDIADTALFLCSSAGSKITGQAIPVDGYTENL